MGCGRNRCPASKRCRIVGHCRGNSSGEQDGFDGGYVARDDKGNEAWGETADDARKHLKEMQR